MAEGQLNLISLSTRTEREAFAGVCVYLYARHANPDGCGPLIKRRLYNTLSQLNFAVGSFRDRNRCAVILASLKLCDIR